MVGRPGVRSILTRNERMRTAPTQRRCAAYRHRRSEPPRRRAPANCECRAVPTRTIASVFSQAEAWRSLRRPRSRRPHRPPSGDSLIAPRWSAARLSPAHRRSRRRRHRRIRPAPCHVRWSRRPPDGASDGEGCVVRAGRTTLHSVVPYVSEWVTRRMSRGPVSPRRLLVVRSHRSARDGQDEHPDREKAKLRGSHFFTGISRSEVRAVSARSLARRGACLVPAGIDASFVVPVAAPAQQPASWSSR